MLTKEEYKKTLIRMWDSVRDNDDDMGKPSCAGVSCIECPLYLNDAVCKSKIYNAYDIISSVEEWGKEHPLKTNGSIYLKAFPNSNVCGYEDNGKILHIRLDKSKPSNADGNMIEVPAEWWDKEVE